MSPPPVSPPLLLAVDSDGAALPLETNSRTPSTARLITLLPVAAALRAAAAIDAAAPEAAALAAATPAARRDLVDALRAGAFFAAAFFGAAFFGAAFFAGAFFAATRFGAAFFAAFFAGFLAAFFTTFFAATFFAAGFFAAFRLLLAFFEEDDFLELLPDDLRDAFRDAAIRCLLSDLCVQCAGVAFALHENNLRRTWFRCHARFDFGASFSSRPWLSGSLGSARPSICSS
jgi:hypothetical protein